MLTITRTARPSTFLAVVYLVVCSLAAPGCDDAACSNPHSEAASCEDRCADCAASCANGSTCDLACQGDCSLSCVNESTCNLQCESGCDAKCDSATSCDVAVGPGSTVSCDNGADCTVQCQGDCTVHCGTTVDTCDIYCIVDGSTVRATKCDDESYVCGSEC